MGSSEIMLGCWGLARLETADGKPGMTPFAFTTGSTVGAIFRCNGKIAGLSSNSRRDIGHWKTTFQNPRQDSFEKYSFKKIKAFNYRQDLKIMTKLVTKHTWQSIFVKFHVCHPTTWYTLSKVNYLET